MPLFISAQFDECAGIFSGNCLLYDIGSLSKAVCYRPNTCMTNHSIVCIEHKGNMCEYFSSTRNYKCKFRTIEIAPRLSVHLSDVVSVCFVYQMCL